MNLFSSLRLLTNVQLLPDVLVRDHQRNEERKIEREREIYDKELAHLWRLSPKIQWLAGDPKELVVVFPSPET